MNKPFSLKSPNQRNTKRNPGPFTHQDEGSFEFLNNSPLSRPIGKPLQRELNNNQSDSSVEFICETVLVPSTTIQSAYNHQGQQYLQNMSVSTPNQPTTQPDPYRASSLSPNRINQTPVRRFSASPVLEGHGHPSEEFEFASEEEYWTEYPNYPVEDLSSFLNRRSIDWDDEDNFDSLAAQQAQYANVLPYDDGNYCHFRKHISLTYFELAVIEFQSRNFADEELEREYDLEVELMEEQNIRDEQAARRAFAAQDKEVEEELYDNEESGDRSMLEDFDNIMELS